MNGAGSPPCIRTGFQSPALRHRFAFVWLLVGALICALCLALFSSSTFAVSGKGSGPTHAAPFHHLRDGKPRPPDGGKGKGRGKKKSITERVRENFPKWRGQELNKVLREVSRRDPARGNKFLKEGLSAHEGGPHKGHTISRHVAVSAKHLEARIEYEKRRSADRKQRTRRDHTALKMEHISTFKSLREANRLVEKTLTDHQNIGRLKSWAKNKNAVDPKTGSKQLLELTLRDAGSVTGLAMNPKSKKLAEARGVRVVLRRSNGKRGWAIVTAHPVVKAERAGRDSVASGHLSTSNKAAIADGKAAPKGKGKSDKAPDFVVSRGGTVFPVPAGAKGPTPVVNPSGKTTGMAFTGGKGGANKQVDTMRIMDPTPPRGETPGYQKGYVKYENKSGQGVDPHTGRTLSNKDSHFPID